MIPSQEFGRTGHPCSRVIFGAWALNEASQAQADNTMSLLQEYGVNCIDTSPMYGKAEKLIGPWLAKHRKEYFVATKTRRRSRQGALKNLRQSLDNLQVECIDLWQMHGLTNPSGWKKAMGPGGALEAFIEARENGYVRFLGVTGHGIKVPSMHIRSLDRYDFDSVLLPYNYIMMQNPSYASDFNELVGICKKRKVALQTIKSVARRSWGSRPKTHNTYFYEPLEKQEAIDKSVCWSLGLVDSFMVSVGDLQLLPKVLDAANRFEVAPSEVEMSEMVDEYNIQSIFLPPRRGIGRQTWGGQMNQIIGNLIREGFFDLPNRRNVMQVLDALESNGLPSLDKKKNVASALAGREKKGVLKKTKTSKGWIYWVE